ncbi:MAG TPA: sigma-70 family RNA polymerase sigma factor [Ktedonobacteraceae bacterium]|nr:sigma-70 family RNA polymerase sigma factor [Ktedonobacteraceae bacterium]
MIISLSEVVGVVEQEHAQAAGLVFVGALDDELVKRRVYLASIYDSLPAYGLDAFWKMVETANLKSALPLEILVKCVRAAIAYADSEGRNRLVTIIIRRIQLANEYWAQRVLNTLSLRAEEQYVLFNDLYADLCENLIRAIIDPGRMFWEENFPHCLRFERQHVYYALMVREGRWQHQSSKQPERIPYTHITSLDQPAVNAEGETMELDVSDEQAQQALLAIEFAELPRLVLQLPQKLKAVVWLIFWEGRTEKDAARILGISDQTVRKRLREALGILREKLEAGREDWL